MLEKIQITSMRYPCGVTLLANVLLELDIYTYIQSRGHWWDRKSKKVIFESEQIEQSVAYMPFFNRGFNDSTELEFINDLEVSWGHQPPASQFTSSKNILLYRHYRGALFSQFKREQLLDSSLTLEKFLSSAGNYFSWSTLDEWSAYHYLWLILSPSQNVVSFESLKTSPEKTISDLLKSYGLALDVNKISKAINASSVENTKKSFQVAQAKNPNLKEGDYIRKGDPNEHKDSWSISTSINEDFCELVQSYLETNSGEKAFSALEKISWGELLDKLELKYQCEFQNKQRLLKLLSYGAIYEAEQLCKNCLEKDGLGERIFLYAHHLTWQLRGSSLFYSYARMMDYSDEQTVVTFKALLYLLGEISSPQNILVCARNLFQKS